LSGLKVFGDLIFGLMVGQHLKLDAKVSLALEYSQVDSTCAKASLLQQLLQLTRRHRSYEE
jgi:hypothetical protein